MPHAPTDYQLRYPIDFGDIDPRVVQKVVQLYAADGVKSKGILYQPVRGIPRTVVIMAHPRADFAHHYSIPFWVEAGFAAFGQNTRYLNNDSTMLHENLLLDLAAGIKYLREEEGFRNIVMLGNSGGGSLFAYYDSQARLTKGERVASPPGGSAPDLNNFDLPIADGFIALAAHPGQGAVLMGSLDAAVVDESDPFATDPALDMYDERNGFRTPPEPSRYPSEWLARYREAQRARAARIDAIARRHIAEARIAREAARAKESRRDRWESRSFYAPRDGAAGDGRLSHAGQSELPGLEPRSVRARARIDLRAAPRFVQLPRLWAGPGRHAQRVALDLVGARVARQFVTQYR